MAGYMSEYILVINRDIADIVFEYSVCFEQEELQIIQEFSVGWGIAQ